jgi:hypothetical protein
MNMLNFLSQINILCMGIAVVALSFGGNPAHAGPEQSVKGSSVGIMGTVTDRVEMNTKRAEAAKRHKARRDSAAAEAAKKAEEAKKAKGGAQ